MNFSFTRPLYVLRVRPIGSKHSTAEPSGSILRCHSLHAAEKRCFLSCTLIIMAARITGSIAGTSSGGDGVGGPRFHSHIQTPRMTGDVSIPFANAVITPPGPGIPRRWLLPQKNRRISKLNTGENESMAGRASLHTPGQK